MPTGYFEAKPYRVVGFDEVRMVVAPQSMPAELAAELDARGIPYTTYDGTAEDRTAKLNAVEGVQFSERTGYLLTPAEYGRFKSNWEARRYNHYTKRKNGGILIDMGNLLVYTDRIRAHPRTPPNPQEVLAELAPTADMTETEKQLLRRYQRYLKEKARIANARNHGMQKGRCVSAASLSLSKKPSILSQ